MSQTVIKVENVSKQYKLGLVGTGTISHDLNRLWAKFRGKEDPYLKIGEINDRTVAGNNEFVWAIKDINLEVKQGEIVGIVGNNGAGKSTLLKVLSRITHPTLGNVYIKGRMNSLLEVGTGFHPELTGRENIFLNGAIQGMSRREIQSKLEEIVEFSGVAKYLDTPVKRYSSGMTVRLGFSIAAHLEPDILIVDEVLAVGDIEFQKKCIGKMQDVSQSGRTILIVSHSISAIRNLTSKCFYMDKGQIIAEGPTDKILDLYTQKNLDLVGNFDFSKRVGSGNLKFENICFNSNGPIFSGKEFEIELSFKFSDPSILYSGVRVTVGFDTLEGVRVFNLDTSMKGKTVSLGRDRYKISFKVKKLFLLPGHYKVTVFCNQNAIVQDWIRSVTTIFVQDGNFYETEGVHLETTGFVLSEFELKEMD